MRGLHPWIAALVVVAIAPIATTAALAQDLPTSSAVDPLAVHVAEASRRFAIPQAWIYAVMQVESAGDPRAVSPQGAMGLMQIMPATWTDLRARYGLGGDVFDRRDNVLAGAAYLREMYDRYGAPGFLAAYNAGPGRYDEHLATGRPLPAETLAYVNRLAPMMDQTTGGRFGPSPDPLAWTRAALFVSPSERAIAAAAAPSDRQAMEAPTTGGPPSDGLFVRRKRSEPQP